MTGTVLTVLAQLTNLESAYLNENKFSGQVPSDIGTLPSVRTLLFHDNNLTGTIPTEFMLMSNLESLTLKSNDITGNLNFLCDLGNLRYLEADCSGNIPKVNCSCCSCWGDNVPVSTLLL